jgi:hypothetical protein
MIGLIAWILDEAIEDEHITSNAARGRRMKIHGPKPNGGHRPKEIAE